MPFMVIFDRADGSSGHKEAAAIDEAAHFVERLRNDESIDQIRLFRMEEISFAFRPYYKVELGMPPRMASAAALAGPAPGPITSLDVDVDVAVDIEAPRAAVANGSASGLFRR